MIPIQTEGPMSRLFRFLIGAVSAFALSCIILGVAYATGLLAGEHAYVFELPIKLSAPFAIILGIIAAIYPTPRDSRKHNAFMVAALGAAVGCLYWYLSERLTIGLHFTGRWQWGVLSLDYELQAASCWVAAGASAMLAAVIRRAPTVLVTTVILCSLAVVLPAPVFNRLTKNQELTVALATPVRPGTSVMQPPQVILTGSEEFDVTKVTSHVLETLRASGLQGEYCVTNLYRIGTGKKSLQIIVVSTPVAGRARLPQPDATELIYVQRPDSWERIPSQAPTLGRSTEVWRPRDRNDLLAYFGIPDASGISVGGRVPSN